MRGRAVASSRFFILILTLGLMLCGCKGKKPQQNAPAIPAVPVSEVVEREITDFVYFTGRLEAIQLVDIRPRVTGYVVKIPFREGAEVKKDDLLFEIDPRPYQAQLDQAEGQVKLYEAQLKLAKVTLERDRNIAKTPGAISQQQIDQDEASVEEAEARLKAFNASLEVYRLNVEFTQVKSPIDGQVSRYYLTVGNLVNQDQTLLTTVVSNDPIYAYFDVDEPTVIRVRRAINEGKIKRYLEGTIPVNIGLQGEEGFPYQGTLNFVNNQVNPATGSILVRGIFPNPTPPAGQSRIFSPGMFVRVQLPIGQPHSSILVIDQAIGSDQGLKYVYVVGKDNKVEYRRITTGALQDDGLRAVITGLKKGESIVVGALQQVHAKIEIKPDRVEMPKVGQPENGSDGDNQQKKVETEPGKEKNQPASQAPDEASKAADDKPRAKTDEKSVK